MNYYNEVTPKDEDSNEIPVVDFSEDYLKEDDSDIEIISTTTSLGGKLYIYIYILIY